MTTTDENQRQDTPIPRKLKRVTDTAAPPSISRSRRFWQRLGFGECPAPVFPKDKDFADDNLVTQVKIKFSLSDRLRLLLTGRMMVNVTSQTYPRVKRARSKTRVSVLAPGQK